jgi:hypothetical protein
LYRAFNARIPVNSQEDMEVVRHHYEVVQFELAGQGVCTSIKSSASFCASKNRRSMKVLHPAKNVRRPGTILRRSDFRLSFTIGSG